MPGTLASAALMSRVLIVSEPRVAGCEATPLERSLERQTDTGWTLDTTDPDVIATVLVDDDSRLRPDTIALLRAAIVDDPTIEAVLGDALVDGIRALRPAWSPTRLLGTADELDLLAMRGPRHDGSLAGRVTALAGAPDGAIGHLPAVLLDRDGPVPIDAAAKTALTAMAAARRGTARPGPVTFLIPTAGTRHPDGRPMVLGAIDAARRAHRDGESNDEIVLIVGEEFDGEPEDLAAPDTRILRRPFPWNFAAAVNLGLVEASNGTVVLLNDDIEAVESGWLTPMIDHLRDLGVGLVGASLTYPDDRIQHHGMVIDDAFPLHAHVGRRRDDLPVAARVAHEVAAVTAACVVGRRSHLLEVGGLWEALPGNFNDTDLCLKLHRAGRRVILEPDARLVHFESASREARIDPWEWDTFIGRWGGVEDPWYHPGYHRPDDPHDRRRNADHLPADDPVGAWPLRTATIRPRPHRSRLRPDAETEAEG